MGQKGEGGKEVGLELVVTLRQGIACRASQQASKANQPSCSAHGIPTIVVDGAAFPHLAGSRRCVASWFGAFWAPVHANGAGCASPNYWQLAQVLGRATTGADAWPGLAFARTVAAVACTEPSGYLDYASLGAVAAVSPGTRTSRNKPSQEPPTRRARRAAS